MTEIEQTELFEQAKNWFKEKIMVNHVLNTKKLKNASEFAINPFLTPYLAMFQSGELTPEALARALIVPRVLSASITTSFGTNIQKFISDVLGHAHGSVVDGIDIEFIDSVDGRKKYCQLKLGPNTINSGDVETIHQHFDTLKRRSKTNSLNVGLDDLVVGVLYGEVGEQNGHYKSLAVDYNYSVFVGAEFWYRLTGAKNFYEKLIRAIADLANEANGKQLVEDTVQTLSKTKEIQALAAKLNK